MDLEGKTCLVIGAGRGIGRRVAELFSKAGANIVISSRTESDLLELEYQLNSEGNSNVLVAVADAANEGDARQIVSRAAERFGSVDYLIHAAGLGVLKPFSELNNSDLDAMLNANVRSAFNIFQAVLPLM